MKREIKIPAFPALLGILLVIVIVMAVTAMAQDEMDSENAGLDIVDNATLQERTPPVILELRNKGCSDEEIADAIISLPRVSYLSGWTEEDDKRVSPLLQREREELNYSMHGTGQTLSSTQDSSERMFPSGLIRSFLETAKESAPDRWNAHQAGQNINT